MPAERTRTKRPLDDGLTPPESNTQRQERRAQASHAREQRYNNRAEGYAALPVSRVPGAIHPPMLTKGFACKLQIAECLQCTCRDTALPEAAEDSPALRRQPLGEITNRYAIRLALTNTFGQPSHSDVVQDQ